MTYAESGQSPDAPVPSEVRAVVERYLQQVDQVLPGRIEGLYLVGSVALDDYQPPHSDIDFVALVAEPLGDTELAVLETLHAAQQQQTPRPPFSGIYVTWRDLAGN